MPKKGDENRHRAVCHVKTKIRSTKSFSIIAVFGKKSKQFGFPVFNQARADFNPQVKRGATKEEFLGT